MEEAIATEHLAGPYTPSHYQRCLRCGLALSVTWEIPRVLIPIYSDYFGIEGRFKPYEPVWVLNGAIWPVSPDPEKVKIIFCGAAH